MTVESNDEIAIATLSDWLKKLAPVFQPMTEQNQSHLARVIFLALRASYRSFLGIVIGSWRCLFLFCLVRVIALVLVFRKSFENRSNDLFSR